MTIKTFIQQEILLPRLKQNGVLVVYDPDQRYQELCLELKTEKLRVIDTSESSITSRRDALVALQLFGQPHTSLDGILIYVPAKPPLCDEEKQYDPFAIFGAVGAAFPDGDGDEYLSLCLKAKPDQATEIRRIFSTNSKPAFEVIDAIGAGSGWPTLQALLRVESARDILFVLLAPSELQLKVLKKNNTWIEEANLLCQSTLGLTLTTKIHTWSAIADELWRFLLFSEFDLDLPVDLPASLTNVPKAPVEAHHLVADLCDRLRNDRRTQAVYIERAEVIEQDLNLAAHCLQIDDFGERDTFPFEERACFDQAVDALKRDHLENLHRLIERHDRSVWVSRVENETQWNLLVSATNLVKACEDGMRQLPEHKGKMYSLVSYYLQNLKEIDRRQREFEQAIADQIDLDEPSRDVMQHARKTYKKIVNDVHDIFLRHLEKGGWPYETSLANADVFEKFIAARLSQSGYRVAFIMVDAMRYELGVELAKQIDEMGQVELQAACAQVPTITPVGMASLLPEASQGLRLTLQDDRLVVQINDLDLNSVTQRMALIQARYGARFQQMDLSQFVRENPKLDQKVELFVLRTNEMDNQFETNPESAPGLISRTFQKVRVALHRLQMQGFQDAILVTDHGFFLNSSLEPGDVCAKPPGKWLNVHDRLLLGDGSSDIANLVLSAEKVGLKGDFNQIAVPCSLVAYRAGQVYFHGGISLQEAIVPVISLHFQAIDQGISSHLTVKLSYNRGAKITTHVPVIEIEASTANLFAQATELLLEAHDQKGNVVGEAKPGSFVDPATRIITIKPAETIQITLKMDLEFEGKFTIKALDPTTQTAMGEALQLETDYMV